MKKITKIIAPIFAVLLSIAGFLLLKETAPANIPKPILEKQWPVKAKKLQISDVRPNISEFGTIVAGNKADIRSLVSGRIIKIGEKYKRGAIVKKGQILAVLDSFDYKLMLNDSLATLSEINLVIEGTKSELKAERQLLKISKSQLKLRERDLTRRQKLRKKGSSSSKSADDAEIAFNDASELVASREQSIIRLKSKLAELNGRRSRARTAIKLAKRNLSETKIFAPFDGFLADTHASVGQYISPNDQFATLIDAEQLEVQFRLKKRDFASLVYSVSGGANELENLDELLGKKLIVRWTVGKKSLELNGLLSRVGAEIAANSGGFKVFGRLLNLNINTPLRPGAFVEVILPDRLYKQVYKIPSTALVGRNLLYVIKNGYLLERKVTIIREIKDAVLVRGDLTDGQEYVSHIFPELTSGLRAVLR